MPNNLVLPKQKADKEYFIEVLRALDSENRTFTNDEVSQYVSTRINTSRNLNKPTELHRYFGFSKTEGPGSNKITILGKLLLEALNTVDQTKTNDLIMLSIDEFKLRKKYLKINPESNIEGITLIIKALKELSTASIKDISYVLSNVKNNGSNYDTCIAEVRENSNSPVADFENSIQRKFNDNKIIALLASLNFISKSNNSYSLSQDVLNRYSLTIDSLVFLNDVDLYPENLNDVSEENSTSFFNSDFPRNRIIFGAPGTGKSYTFNKESVGHKDYPDEDYLLKNGGEYERVTFHPDYSYAQFVGTYKPTTSSVDDNFIPLLSDIKSIDDLTESKFNELANRISDEIGGTGSRTLLVLLGLKFPDANIKRQITDIAQAATDISSSPDTQINYAIKAAKYLQTESSGDIIYEYVPGPFMRTLVKALNNKKSNNIKPYLLLIEEINRANVSAVFGDVFQLLDRDDSNQSEYPIQASEDMKKYLVKELDGDISDYAQIRIPDNMFIWATMNSADQGVFPMDTAFKRRWDFTYQGINEGENDIESFNHKMGGSQVSVNWNDLRKAINAELITYNINEDKLMGAHFVNKESLKDKETFDKTFKSKVIMYLFDDAAKQKRSSLFSGVVSPRSFKLYSDICEAYDEVGIGIFSEPIKVKFDNQINNAADFEED